jgi:hypothetical protein
MTTATQTKFNVLAMAPVIDVTSNDSRTTAERFVDNNLRHIVNRRMKWTEVPEFVLTSLQALQFATSGVISGTSVYLAIDDAFETIRVCTNRRWSWQEAQPVLIKAIMDVIEAAKRLL